MNRNKQAKLIAAAYRVLRTCGNCAHSDLAASGTVGLVSLWSKCKRLERLGWNEESRRFGVHAFGTCSSHALRRNTPIRLGDHTPFLEPEECNCPDCTAGEMRSAACEIWKARHEGRDGRACHCGSTEAIAARADGTGKRSVCANCGLPWPAEVPA